MEVATLGLSDSTLEQTGTFLNEAAAEHARILRPVLDKYSADAEAMSSRLPPNGTLNPSNFYPDAHPTKVVRMNLTDDLAEKLRRELRIQAKIQSTITGAFFGTYFPLSTMFENSVLFIPSAKRFYDLNMDIVHHYFPQVHTAVINAFVVPAGKIPYGTHSASSIALQIPSLVEREQGFPTLYKSFHTALVPSPLERQPFVIFEEAEVDAPNLQYVYQFLQEYELDADEKADIDKALYLFLDGNLSENHLPTVRDFLMAKYWEKKYQDKPSPGYFCNSKVGDALFFDNYRAHADNTLPMSEQDRVTIDFRCFNEVKYPDGMSSGLDFIVDPRERVYQTRRKRQGIEFLLMALGYESYNEFIKLIFGKVLPINPFELMTDLQFGIYNKSKYHLLDQNLDAHYERVERLYEKIEADGEYVLPERAHAAMKTLQNS